ncbi:MAG: hypothetical protein ACXAEU_20040 [Candidatus Hodarchaeales archaeon]|jgi:hypothetical protein
MNDFEDLEDKELERQDKELERQDKELERQEEELEQQEEELEKTKDKRVMRAKSKIKRKTAKTITIRGIDVKIYDEFSQNMKVLGMTIGDAFTKMMKDILTDFNGTFPDLSAKSFKNEYLARISIRDHAHIVINAKDLIESNALVTFDDIDHLEFEPDVTGELFLRHVKAIRDCDTVKMPNILPKLLVYSKLMDCDDIEFYEVDEIVKE